MMTDTTIELKDKIKHLEDFLGFFEVKYQWPVQFEGEDTSQYLTPVLDDVNQHCQHRIHEKKEDRKKAYDLLLWAINDDTDEAEYRRNYYQSQQSTRDSEARILASEIEYQRQNQKDVYQVNDDDLEYIRAAGLKKKQHWAETTDEQHQMNREQNSRPDPSVQEQMAMNRANWKPKRKIRPKPRASEQDKKEKDHVDQGRKVFYHHLANELKQA